MAEPSLPLTFVDSGATESGQAGTARAVAVRLEAVPGVRRARVELTGHRLTVLVDVDTQDEAAHQRIRDVVAVVLRLEFGLLADARDIAVVQADKHAARHDPRVRRAAARLRLVTDRKQRLRSPDWVYDLAEVQRPH